MRTFRGIAWLLGLAVAAAPAAAWPAEDEAANPPRVIVLEGRSAGAEEGVPARIAVVAHAARRSEYWIGVEAHAVPDALRAHLKLPEGQGLLVEQVLPDSPAAKAKIQRHDVLVKAGGKPLNDVADLIEAVGASQGKPLALELIRAGKTVQAEVTPAKPPKELAGQWDWLRAEPEYDAMMKWIDRFRPGLPGHPPMRFRVWRPGAVLPPGAAAMPPLPSGMTVAVTKQGDQPAKIHVTRGDEKWDVTENELDKLPADIRPHVERMLGRGPFAGVAPWVDFVPTPAAPGKPQPKVDVVPKAAPAPPAAHVEKRLDELTRQLERLQKSVDDLRGRLPGEAKSPKK